MVSTRLFFFGYVCFEGLMKMFYIWIPMRRFFAYFSFDIFVFFLDILWDICIGNQIYCPCVCRFMLMLTHVGLCLCLKGHCHAIWQLHKVYWHPLNSKSNGLVLKLKTIWMFWNCFLSPVHTDGMDGNGLKLEKLAIFFEFWCYVFHILQKFLMVSPLWYNSFDIFVVALQKHFVYG